jgi:hypothetical protein
LRYEAERAIASVVEAERPLVQVELRVWQAVRVQKV